MKFLPLKVYPRPFAVLALSFIIATIAGTVSHEAGHYSVAKLQGYNAKLHYASVSLESWFTTDMTKFDSLYKADEIKILAKESSPEKEYFIKYRESLSRDFYVATHKPIIFTMGGPLQTMITGSLGLLYLWYYLKKIILKNELSVKEWFAVLLAFFWSRQIFNALSAMVCHISRGSISRRGDEAKISLYFKLPIYTVNIITGLIGLVLLFWVTFYIIPKQQRFSFIIAGLIGSTLGFVIWMQWIGPVVLP